MCKHFPVNVHNCLLVRAMCIQLTFIILKKGNEHRIDNDHVISVKVSVRGKTDQKKFDSRRFVKG